MLLWCLIEKFVLKFGYEKRVFLTKIHFYIKLSMEISGKGLLHFYQQAPSLIGNQTNFRTNMFCLINPTLAMSQTMRAFVLNTQCSFKYFEQCINDILGIQNTQREMEPVFEK